MQTLCLVEMIEASTCSLTNQTCVCTDVEFVNAITLCVAQNCTIREQLGKNFYKQSEQDFNFTSCAKVLQGYLWCSCTQQNLAYTDYWEHFWCHGSGSIYSSNGCQVDHQWPDWNQRIWAGGHIPEFGYSMFDIKFSTTYADYSKILMVPFFIFSWLRKLQYRVEVLLYFAKLYPVAKAGLGRDIWEVPPNDITSVLYVGRALPWTETR